MIQLFWEKNWHIKVKKISAAILIIPKYSVPVSLAKVNKSMDPQKTLIMNVVYLFLGDIISCLEKIQEKYKKFS